jgi:hypothetical protein
MPLRDESDVSLKRIYEEKITEDQVLREHLARGANPEPWATGDTGPHQGGRKRAEQLDPDETRAAIAKNARDRYDCEDILEDLGIDPSEFSF